MRCAFLSLLLFTFCCGSTNADAFIQGHIKDSSGLPLKHKRVTASLTHVRNGAWVIPIYVPGKVVGVVGANDGPTEVVDTKSAKTDKNGFYRIIVTNTNDDGGWHLLSVDSPGGSLFSSDVGELMRGGQIYSYNFVWPEAQKNNKHKRQK